MEKAKLTFVNEHLKWGYLADITGYYHDVFEPSLADWPKQTEDKWPEGISIVELINRDIRGITHKNWPVFIEKMKKYDVKLTAHDSFMRNEFYDVKTDNSTINAKIFFADTSFSKQGNIINFFWYVVPKNYNGPFPAYKKSIEQGFEDIDFAYMCGADRITMHVTKPGLRLDEKEFEEYTCCWKELNEHGLEQDVSVLVETGGISEEQLIKLKNLDARFNLDTAHALLDSIDPLSIYEKIKDNIKEVHLSMTKNNQDYHEGINYTGEGYSPELRKINAEIIRSISERRKSGEDIALILEVKPSSKDVDFLYAALKGEE